MATNDAGIAGLGARVHLFVQPTARDAFTSLFRDVLGCDVSELDLDVGYRGP
ncbi:MAG: hypothetical protein ACYDAK_04415 [Candidatus Limnocylindrales bacterium]